MSIPTISEAAASKGLAQVLDQAATHPIIIKRGKGPKSFLVIDADRLEDAWLKDALKNPDCHHFIGIAESEDFIDRMLHA